jgi:hypothetical protein
MNTPTRWMIRLLLLSSFILHPSSFLRADGGTVRLSQRQGDYRITVFTTPTPLRAGPVDVSVLVQDARTGQPVPQARVTVRAAPRGRSREAILQPATSEAATNKLFRAAVFELPEPGWWEVEVAVEGGRAPARARFEVEAAEAAPRWLALWPWLGWPAVAILLFSIHQVLVRRKERAGTQVGLGSRAAAAGGPPVSLRAPSRLIPDQPGNQAASVAGMSLLATAFDLLVRGLVASGMSVAFLASLESTGVAWTQKG